MGRITLLLLIAAVTWGCAKQPVYVSGQTGTDLQGYSSQSFANIYGLPNLETSLDGFYDVSNMEASLHGSNFVLNLRLRSTGQDHQYSWTSFEPSAVNTVTQMPIQVSASCTDASCFRIAVLVSYYIDPVNKLVQGVMMQQSTGDTTYYKVVYSAPGLTQSYQN